MRYRVMRLMIMFDLPTDTSNERRAYRQFRKRLLNDGFFMMQYSVYVKVCPNKVSAKHTCDSIRANAPEKGLIQSIIVTEKQYQDMEFIVGKPVQDAINSSERTIFL